MTSERDIERILDHWFAERPTEAPDRVLDEVAGRIARQPQQPGWLVWRDSHVNAYLKYAAAVAAVILVAAVGFAVLGSRTDSGLGGPVTPSPSPSPVSSPVTSTTPSPAPSVSNFPAWFVRQADGAGLLPGGVQTTRRFKPGSTFVVPDGWVNEADHEQIYGLFPDTPANQTEYARSGSTANNMTLVETIANNMFAICPATGLFQGTTAAEVINGVVANDALLTTEPVDVTIGGLSGRQIEIQLDPDWAPGCPLDADDPPTSDYSDVRNRLIVLDTPDGRTVGIAIGSTYSSDYEAFLAEAMPIVESLQFDLTP